VYSSGELIRARKVLGITADATPDEIRRAHRDLIKVWHPDRFGDDSRLQARAEEELKRINGAYAVLISCNFPGRAGEGMRTPVTAPFETPPELVFVEDDFGSAKGIFSRFRMKLDVPVVLVAVLLTTLILAISNYEPSVPRLQADERNSASVPAGLDEPASIQPQEKLTRVLLPEYQYPPFKNIAGLLASGISQRDYDALRSKYYNEIAVLKTGPDSPLETMKKEFFSETERPEDSVGSGLTFPAAERLMDILLERAHLYFTVGSTTDEVRSIQGSPTRVESGSVDPSETIWTYGFSSVYFKDGKVSHWTDQFSSLASVSRIKPLRATRFPRESRTRRQFSVGSTKDDVFWAQGPPDEFSEHTWKYGSSNIAFDGGKVTGWKESADSPLKYSRALRETASNTHSDLR
jgi:hypothetical protein